MAYQSVPSDEDITRLTSEQIAQFFDDIKSGNLFAVKDAVNTNPAYLTCRTEDEWEYTGLHWASQKGYPEIVAFLLSKGADFHLEAKKVPWKPILLAARYGHKSIVEMFLDAGEEIDVQINCDSKYTPLHYACHHGHVDIVKLLLERHTSISLVSGHGLRPIHTAANNGQAACVGLLLQYGEDVDVVHNSEWRYTPLHWACQEGKTDVVKLLLEHRANIHIKCGKTPQTALQIAQKNNFTEIISLLQQQELKEIQNSNFKVFVEYNGKKKVLQAKNIDSLTKLKETLCQQLGLSLQVEKYLFEWYLKEFDDYAELDNLDDLPSSVKIRISNREFLRNNMPMYRVNSPNQDMCDIEYADEDGDTIVLDAEEKRGRYHEKRLMGKGTNGVVFLANDNDTNSVCVIKKIMFESEREVNTYMSEYLNLGNLSHNNLVRYNNVYMQTENRPYALFNICFVTEYFEKGDLLSFLAARRQTDIPLSINIVIDYMRQLTDAIAYLHENGVMHSNLKPQNCFLASDYKTLKIADYGLVRTSSSFATTTSSMKYLAPEILSTQKYHFAADIWSLGCIFAEMMLLSLEKVFYMDAYVNSNFYRDIHEAITRRYPVELADLVCSLLTKEPENRPDARSIARRLHELNVKR
jgi:ankyrin repeat protein